jgi:hypothetical protein
MLHVSYRQNTIRNKVSYKNVFIIEFNTQCANLAATSTTLDTFYYHGICYVLKKEPSIVTHYQTMSMCNDFPNQRHKHLAFPSNDKLLDWMYTALVPNVCCVCVCENICFSDLGNSRTREHCNIGSVHTSEYI